MMTGCYKLAAKALAQADPNWLADLITRQVPLAKWADAYARRPEDIKTVLDFSDASPRRSVRNRR